MKLRCSMSNCLTISFKIKNVFSQITINFVLYSVCNTICRLFNISRMGKSSDNIIEFFAIIILRISEFSNLKCCRPSLFHRRFIESVG